MKHINTLGIAEGYGRRAVTLGMHSFSYSNYVHVWCSKIAGNFVNGKQLHGRH